MALFTFWPWAVAAVPRPCFNWRPAIVQAERRAGSRGALRPGQYFPIGTRSVSERAPRDIYLGDEPGSGTSARTAIWFENGETSINQVALRDVSASVLGL